MVGVRLRRLGRVEARVVPRRSGLRVSRSARPVGRAGSAALATCAPPRPEPGEQPLERGRRATRPGELGAEDGESEEDDEPTGARKRNEGQSEYSDASADDGDDDAVDRPQPRVTIDSSPQPGEQAPERMARVFALRDVLSDVGWEPSVGRSSTIHALHGIRFDAIEPDRRVWVPA